MNLYIYTFHITRDMYKIFIHNAYFSYILIRNIQIYQINLYINILLIINLLVINLFRLVNLSSIILIYKLI